MKDRTYLAWEIKNSDTDFFESGEREVSAKQPRNTRDYETESQVG
jgi:hypothetical protein